MADYIVAAAAFVAAFVVAFVFSITATMMTRVAMTVEVTDRDGKVIKHYTYRNFNAVCRILETSLDRIRGRSKRFQDAQDEVRDLMNRQEQRDKESSP